MATSVVSGAPSASISVKTISPHAAADSSTQLIGAVAGVAGMVIDVHHRRSIEARDAGARQLAALHDQRRVERLGDFGRDADRRRRPETAAGRPAGCASMTTVASLPMRAQRERHGHRRADRVAVGPLVRGDDEALPLPDAFDELSGRVRHS